MIRALLRNLLRPRDTWAITAAQLQIMKLERRAHRAESELAALRISHEHARTQNALLYDRIDYLTAKLWKQRAQ